MLSGRRNHWPQVLAVVGLFLIIGQTVLAQECVEHQEHMRWIGSVDTGNWTRGVDVQDHRAYVVDGFSGLSVVDIRFPGTPLLMGIVETPGRSRDIEVSGRYAYVADTDSGLVVVDVWKSSRPQVAAVLELPGRAWAIAVADDRAYVANHEYGFQVIDIKHPTAPVLVGSLEGLPGRVDDVTVRGDLAYVAASVAGLLVIDVSNPAEPTVIGQYPTEEYARCVYIDGDIVYLGTTGDFQVIDVTDPTAPVRSGGVTLPVGVGDIHVLDDHAYVAHHGSIGIFDLTNDAAPVWLGRMRTYGTSYALTIANRNVYMAAFGGGLQIHALAGGLLSTSERTTEGVELPVDVAYQGGFAYLADYHGVTIMTAPAPPAVPEHAGGFDGLEVASGIAVAGDYAYVSDEVGRQLVIGDVSSPLAHPIASIETPEMAGDVAVSGGLAVVACGNYYGIPPYRGGIMFVDVNDPREPLAHGYFDTEDLVYRVAMDGQYVYASIHELGVAIIDVADPRSPAMVAVLPTLTGFTNITKRDNLLYAANREFHIADLTDLSRPFVKSSIPLPYHASGMDVSDRYAYVSTGVGLQVVDIARPRAPFICGSVSFAGNALGVALGSGRVHVAVAAGAISGLQYFARGCEDGTVEAEMDVEPAVPGNVIDCSSTNLLQVALLTTDAFDALDTDHRTVTFGPGEAREVRVWNGEPYRHEYDIDDDGDVDLVFAFRVADTGLDCTETEVSLSGLTFDGREILCTVPMQGVGTVNKRPGRTLSSSPYPNPFNPSTTIGFELQTAGPVDLRIYDLSGRLVRTLLSGTMMPAQRNTVVWSGNDDQGRQVSSGVYFYVIESGGYRETERLMLIK